MVSEELVVESLPTRVTIQKGTDILLHSCKKEPSSGKGRTGIG